MLGRIVRRGAWVLLAAIDESRPLIEIIGAAVASIAVIVPVRSPRIGDTVHHPSCTTPTPRTSSIRRGSGHGTSDARVSLLV